MRRRRPQCSVGAMLGAALLLSSAGCGEARRRPLPPAPVVASAAPAVKPCVPWDEAGCEDGCKHGSSTDCRRLWQFYTGHARGAAWSWDPDHAADPEVLARAQDAHRRALALEASACEAGDAEACEAALDPTRVRWGSTFPQVPAAIRERVVAAASARCDKGEAETCEALLLDEARLSEEAVSARATALLGVRLRACESGDAKACTRAADMLDDARGAWGRARRWKRPPSATSYALELRRRGCAAGDPRSCETLSACLALGCGSILRQDQLSPGLATEPMARAISIYESRCREGREGACAELARLLPDRRAYEVLRPSCDAGSMESCATAVGRFLQDDSDYKEMPGLGAFSPDEQKAMLATLRRDALALCKRGESRRCERIDPRWFAKGSAEEREVQQIAARFCQVYDRGGVVCTDQMGEICLAYCDPAKGMVLPGASGTR